MNKNPIIGIVGGTGKMGQLFEEFFKKRGHEVLISSRKTKLTNIELAQKSDVVVVAVPLESVIDVINEVAPHVKKEGLLADISAVKEEPVKAMLKSKASVVGMHPVFGPMVKSIKNQTVVLCPARGDEWFQWLEKIFEDAGAKVQISAPEEHDRLMAVIQGMVHFTSIASASTLKKLKIDVAKTFAFASPNYRIATDVVGRILAQNPEVYADIAIHNKYIKEVIGNFQKCSDELFRAIEQKDKEKFQKIFEGSSDYLNDFKDEAMAETNYLIEKIVEKDSKNGNNT